MTGVHVVPHLIVELPTNQTLGGKDGVLRVHDCLSFSRQTNKTLTLPGKRDDRGWSVPLSLLLLPPAFAVAHSK